MSTPDQDRSAPQGAESEAAGARGGGDCHAPDTYARVLREATRDIAQQGYAENIERFVRFRDTESDEWIELQVLKARNCGPNYRPNMAAHIDSELGLARAFEEADKTLQGTGTFYILNRVNPLVRLRAPTRQWNRVLKEQGTTDKDIVSRCGFFFDFDPVRPVKGISASDEESQHAVDAAVTCYGDLAVDLGSDEFLGYGFSGNGVQVHVALDHLPVDEATSLTIKGLLLAAQYRYGSAKVELDTTVSDLKRLCPAWGTVKRKGEDDPERPHRRTWFYCQNNVRRLTGVELDQLLALWMTRLAAGR